MSTRPPITAAQIVGSPVQYAGTINVEKCIKYLRGIGVEVDDVTGDSWLATQHVHRFLRRMKGTAVVFWVHHCQGGAIGGDRRRGGEGSAVAEQAPCRRPQCAGLPMRGMWQRFRIAAPVVPGGARRDRARLRAGRRTDHSARLALVLG